MCYIMHVSIPDASTKHGSRSVVLRPVDNDHLSELFVNGSHEW